MNKINYKKKLSEFYQAKVAKPVVVNVSNMNYIMINGHGDPNTSKEYNDAIQTLYPVAYAIKFMCKRELEVDFGVMPLEGLWWTEDMKDFSVEDKSKWLWTAMIMQPEIVDKAMFERAIKQVSEKKKLGLLKNVSFEAYEDGRSAQVMYVGPYSNEGPTILALHDFIKSQGGKLDKTNKYHHEIYFNDPRRTDPAKLKTIIRQPF